MLRSSCQVVSSEGPAAEEMQRQTICYKYLWLSQDAALSLTGLVVYEIVLPRSFLAACNMINVLTNFCAHCLETLGKASLVRSMQEEHTS